MLQRPDVRKFWILVEIISKGLKTDRFQIVLLEPCNAEK
jgi:hypothetical protein